LPSHLWGGYPVKIALALAKYSSKCSKSDFLNRKTVNANIKNYISSMKSKIIGFALILVACAIVYGFAVFIPFGKNVNLVDFLKGFVIGVGAITGAALVVFLIKKARQKTKAA